MTSHRDPLSVTTWNDWGLAVHTVTRPLIASLVYGLILLMAALAVYYVRMRVRR